MGKARREVDFLDEMIARHTADDPDFPKLVDAARKRRDLGRRLAKRREAAGLSQTKMAARINTSQVQISKIEGGADVRLSMLARYAAAVGCELEVSVRAKRVD